MIRPGFGGKLATREDKPKQGNNGERLGLTLQ